MQHGEVFWFNFANITLTFWSFCEALDQSTRVFNILSKCNIVSIVQSKLWKKENFPFAPHFLSNKIRCDCLFGKTDVYYWKGEVFVELRMKSSLQANRCFYSIAFHSFLILFHFSAMPFIAKSYLSKRNFLCGICAQWNRTIPIEYHSEGIFCFLWLKMTCLFILKWWIVRVCKRQCTKKAR